MSASLVGSEMCIRDSKHGHLLAHSRAHARAHFIDHFADPRVRHSVGSVSYTHLTLPTICSV
eukprot:12623023-Alexandrium_andersonii.AAC.1